MKKKPENQTWSWVILISSLLVILTNSMGNVSIIRILLNVWFLMVCPGLAFVQLLHLSPIWMEITLAVALSLALDGLVSGIMVYTELWVPHIGLFILIILSLLGVLLVQLGVDFSKSKTAS